MYAANAIDPLYSATENLRSVTGSIASSPESCWRALTDAALLPAWLPGLRRARVIDAGADGYPREILFELSTSLVYSLVYYYDVPRREVRWEPRIGRRDGVRGFARLEPAPEGTRITYALDPGNRGSAADPALADPHAIVAAFAAWVEGSGQRFAPGGR